MKNKLQRKVKKNRLFHDWVLMAHIPMIISCATLTKPITEPKMLPIVPHDVSVVAVSVAAIVMVLFL